MGDKARAFDDARRRDKEFLYSVLNLPVYATESEIKERHRALSLVFHPDKQRDEAVKDHAKERFLEVQAAYEILSDPFLREVYDTLGYDGLKLDFPKHFRHLPGDEIRPALRAFLYKHESDQLGNQVGSKATLQCLLDARELIGGGLPSSTWYTDLSGRISSTRLNILSLKHTFVKRISPQSKLHVISKLGQPDQDEFDNVQDLQRFNLLRGNVLGVVTHQYSASKQIQVKASLLRLYKGATVTFTHEDKLNYSRIAVPLRPFLIIPPLSLSVRRRLFPNSLTLGTFECLISRGSTPTISIGLIKPAVPISASSKDSRKQVWLASGWAAGLNLKLPSGPVAYVQWQAVCQALQAMGKIGLEYGPLTGLGGTVEGTWSSEDGEADVTTAVTWDMRGVVLRLSLTYLGQKLEVPVTLADYYAPRLVLGAAVLPAAVFAFADYAILRSKRKEKRLRQREEYENSRRERTHEGRAEAEAVSTMLTEVARKATQIEKSSDGLVILEASYFPVDDFGLAMPELGIDVTIPMQALVSKGQVYLPGGRSKTALRGFYDPLPECEKRLGVRYSFRGRGHYAEVSEKSPLMIPLENHLVGTGDATKSSTRKHQQVAALGIAH